MGIYLGATALGGGGGGGGGSTLEGAKAYRTLIIGGGANGVLGATYGAGGGGAGAFIETAVPFMTGITYNITIAGGGGTTTIDSANGIYTASAGGEGRRSLSGLTGASGGGGSGTQTAGLNHITDYKGRVLGSIGTGQAINSSITLYGTDLFPNSITTGTAGGGSTATYGSGGGGGAGGAGATGTNEVRDGAGGVGLSTNIITVATATSASVGDIQNGSDVYFCGGGYGGRLSTVNTTVLGTGTNTGGGGQSSSVAGGVSSGDSGCVIIKVPADADFTQTGATAYTDQGMTAIIWTGAGTFQIN